MVILNPSPVTDLPDDILSEIDYLVLNEGEAAALTGQDLTKDQRPEDLSAALHDRGVKNVLITLGAKGCFVSLSMKGLPYLSNMSPSQKMLPAQKVKAVDTTAAGDTFAGVFAARLAHIPTYRFTPSNESGLVRRTEAQLEAVAFAQRAAAKTVQKAGAQSSIPWLNEIEAP